MKFTKMEGNPYHMERINLPEIVVVSKPYTNDEIEVNLDHDNGVSEGWVGGGKLIGRKGHQNSKIR